jgi:hypothetical protein
VSARQPPGSHENEPTVDTLISFVSTILERRLVDVVRYRMELRLAIERRRLSSDVSSQGESNDEEFGLASEGGRSTGGDLPPSQAPVLLTSICRHQLRAYVRRIASMYRDNRYHGLEHATHVTMSADKLLEMIHKGSVELTEDVDDTEINELSVHEPHNLIIANRKRPLDDSSQSTMGKNNGFTLSMDSTRNSTDDFFGRCHRPKRSKLQQSCEQRIHPDLFSKFAVTFAAFIHDVDHQGVPNTRLVLENDPIVEQHGSLSVAEKHSINVAFRALSESEFDVFRSVIFESRDDQYEMHRIVANMVLGTDIASPERAQSTRVRWGEAFNHPSPNSSLTIDIPSLGGKFHQSDVATVQASKPQLVPMQNISTTHQSKQPEWGSKKRSVRLNGGQTIEFLSECDDDDDDNDLRTTLQRSVLIETIINVADVAHAMQSWELFLFWNRRLYEELYDAFKMARSEIDPSNDWYENQLGFFKLYIIPLAGKMHECGVFGKIGCEWMKNAVSLRDRWIREGEEITKDMIASVKSI